MTQQIILKRNTTNTTAAAENSGAGRTGGYNPPQVHITCEGTNQLKQLETFQLHITKENLVYTET